MSKKYLLSILIIFVIIISSCLGQRNRKAVIVPVSDTEFFDFTLPVKMEDITESKDGTGTRNLPLWLRAYISGGIEEVEKMDSYDGKYMFIGMSEGVNFIAMSKWAENFSIIRDTTMLVARRIEKKIVTSASLYPDDEYGVFFETVIKNSYSAVYRGAVKEDTYWIRTKVDNENTTTDIYVFFVLLSIDKSEMQSIVRDIMTKSMPSSALTGNQRNAIGRLQNNFFEGF